MTPTIAPEITSATTEPTKHKRVVSVSLGTSKRNKSATAEFLGQHVTIERLGVDGDRKRYKELLAELDGKVDCIGIGGTDAYVYAGGKRYVLSDTMKLVAPLKITPWVDGSGLKHTLEREVVDYVQREGIVDFRGKRILLVSAVDRFGMAEALSKYSDKILYGDFLFTLGLPIPVRKWSTVQTLGRLVLPFFTKLPIELLYPTGKKTEQNTPKYPKYFHEADVIAGDWHIIRRYMPERLDGKTILTSSSRTDEIELLRQRGAKLVITTTPQIAGEAFATNVMEATLVALLERRPEDLTPEDYLGTLKKLGWQPGIIHLQPAAAS